MNTLLIPVAGSLLNVALQGTLLTLAVALALRLLPAVPAGTRSLIWAVAFLLLIGLHFVPHAASAATHHVQPGWAMWLTGVWLAASAWRALRLIAAAFRLRGLCRRALPLGESMPVFGHTSAQLCTSAEIHRPAVAGFFQPRILLPQSLLADISHEERSFVLLHEIAHLRRADNWTNLLQKLALIAFPLDPALLWIERRLCREREFACDERVLAQTEAPRSYAMCLTSLAERGMFARASSLALGAWQRRSELVDRVEQMLQPAASASSRKLGAAAGALVCIALAFGALGIAREPQMFSFASPNVPVLAAADDTESSSGGARMVLTAAHLPARAAAADSPQFNKNLPSAAISRMARRPSSVRRAASFQSTFYVPRLVRRGQTRIQPVEFIQTGASSDSSSPVFVPVATYAVATPEGWLILTI